ncbi:DUF2332 family protein [Paracoccus actinidiae]|uniref:DUF2332 family protein n=1 Tax=Paracoccus actinidiae TaxID=3064531 RepID=UPI00359C6163
MAATPDAPILHLALEAEGRMPGAGLAATLWDGDVPQQQHLGGADFHGQWSEWSPKAAAPAAYPLAT